MPKKTDTDQQFREHTTSDAGWSVDTFYYGADVGKDIGGAIDGAAGNTLSSEWDAAPIFIHDPFSGTEEEIQFDIVHGKDKLPGGEQYLSPIKELTRKYDIILESQSKLTDLIELISREFENKDAHNSSGGLPEYNRSIVLSAISEIFAVDEPEKFAAFIGSLSGFEVKAAQGQHSARVNAERESLRSLPEQAPRKWADRSKHGYGDSEIVRFVSETYAEWLGDSAALSRTKLNEFDRAAYDALREHDAKHGKEASNAIGFVRRGQTSQKEKDDFRAGVRPKNVQDFKRVESAVRREDKQRGPHL